MAGASHGHRAGVIGLPAHRDLEVRGAGDGRDDAEPRPVILENRALLDVQLDEDVDVATHGTRRSGGVEADRTHRVGERDAVGVADAFGFVRLEAIGDGARAPEVGVETAALFLADGDTLEDPRRPAEAVPETRDRFDPRDDAERAVERAAAADRVDVRSGHDRAASARALDAPPDVPDRVASHEETRFFEPAGDELHRRAPPRRLQAAIDPTLRERSALGEIVQPAQEPAPVDRDQLSRRGRAPAAVPSSPAMKRPRGGFVTISPSR